MRCCVKGLGSEEEEEEKGKINLSNRNFNPLPQLIFRFRRKSHKFPGEKAAAAAAAAIPQKISGRFSLSISGGRGGGRIFETGEGSTRKRKKQSRLLGAAKDGIEIRGRVSPSGEGAVFSRGDGHINYL